MLQIALHNFPNWSNLPFYRLDHRLFILYASFSFSLGFLFPCLHFQALQIDILSADRDVQPEDLRKIKQWTPIWKTEDSPDMVDPAFSTHNGDHASLRQKASNNSVPTRSVVPDGLEDTTGLVRDRDFRWFFIHHVGFIYIFFNIFKTQPPQIIAL